MYPGLIALLFLALILGFFLLMMFMDNRTDVQSLKRKEVRLLRERHRLAVQALNEIAQMAADNLTTGQDGQLAMTLIQMKAIRAVIDTQKEIA